MGQFMRMFTRIFAIVTLLLLPACVSPGREISADSQQASISGAYLQGRFAAQAFDIPRAGEAFGEVADRLSGAESQRSAFGFALASGDFDEAEAQAQLIFVQRAEGNEAPEELGIQADMPVLTLASAAMRDGDPAGAAQLLAQPLQSSLGRSLSTLLRSAALYEAEGIEAASRVLTQQDPGTFRGLIPQHVAYLYLLDGQVNAAEAAFRQSLAAPRNEVAALGVSRLLEEMGRHDEARAVYRTMLQDAGLYSRAGRMGLTRLGDLPDEPRTYQQRAADQHLVVADAKGLFALALENYAWLGFEQAIAVQTNNPGAEQLRRSALVIPLGLANLARAVDERRDAAHYLASLVFGVYGTPDAATAAARRISPESWLYTYAKLEEASSAMALGQEDRGPAILRQAISAEGPSPQWSLQVHLYLASLGDFERADVAGTEAIDAAERLGVLPSSLWRYYFSRGAVRLEEGMWTAGRDDLEKALELSPDEPIILNHLGYSYVERGENLDRAFGMIERALEVQPQNGSIVDSLGWAHYQRGNYQQAVEILERAVSLEPADGVITDHLGDAYYMTDRDRDARYEWRRVLELDDADEALKAAAQRKLDGDLSEAPVLISRGSGT